MKKWLWAVLAVALAAAFYFPFLSRLPLEEADEATYAIIAREMAQNNSYLTMTYDGNPWFEKPPLLFWLSAASAKVFGVNEFAFRLIPAFFSVLTVFFVAAILKTAFERQEIALSGGIAMVLFPLFLAAARNFRMDAPVAAMMFGAVWSCFKSKEKNIYAALIGIFIAVGFLFKSVVALMVLPILFIYGFVYREWAWLKSRHFWIGIILGAAVVLPWHIYEYVLFGGQFLTEYFGTHVFGRFTENIIQSGITPAYIAAIFWRYGQPWSSALIVSLIIFCVSLFIDKNRYSIYKQMRLAAFSLASGVFLGAIFMTSKTKLITYFIPVYPFLAVFLASVYWGLLDNLKENRVWVLRSILILLVMIGGVFSFREAFLDSRLYVSRQVFDAKPIGRYLASVSSETPIFSYEYQYDKAIKYYSGKTVIGMREEDGRMLKPPFYLIIPTDLLKKNDWLNKFDQPHRGAYLTLVFVSA